jgi:hypothetical protein
MDFKEKTSTTEDQNLVNIIHTQKEHDPFTSWAN